MKSFSFSSLLMLPLAFFFVTGGQVSAQEDVCPDCTVAYENVQSEEARITTERELITVSKEQIEFELNSLRLDTPDPVDSEFAEAIGAFIATAGCATEENYEDISPSIDGVRGYIYEDVFFCPITQEFEQLVTDVFSSGALVDLSGTYDPDHVAKWTGISNLFLELEQEFDDFFLVLANYDQALADWTECTEALLQLQEQEQCTETDPVFEEIELPAEEENFPTCPECSEHAQALEAIEAEIMALEEQIAINNSEIETLSAALSANTQFAADLGDLIETVGCATELTLDEIETDVGQTAGELYRQVFYCQNEESTEALTVALEIFWETHEAPGDDAETLANINAILAEIETLQDQYNTLLAEKVALSETYQECLNLLLTLQDQNMCQEEVEDLANSLPPIIASTPPTTSSTTTTIPAQKRRGGGGGGSSKVLRSCSESIFSNISPAPNTSFAVLDSISFDAVNTIILNTIQLTVSGETLELKAAKNTNGSYSITAHLPKPITQKGKYRVELFGTNNTQPVSCSRTRLFTLEVNPALAPNEVGTLSSSTIDFPDIAGHWAREFILKLVTRGVVNGYVDGKFRPDANITRAELTKIALRSFALGTEDTRVKPFSDVALNEWYTPYVARAKVLGVVTGYTDKTFRPNTPVTRAEGLKILINAANLDTSEYANKVSKFHDVARSQYYNGYVNWAAEKGIISGYQNGNFGPNDRLTRAQLAKMAINLLDFLNR